MLDFRIPLRFAQSVPAPCGNALLIEGDAPVAVGVVVQRFVTGKSVHRVGCACCAGRPAASVALGQLFLARARGEVAWFDSVTAVVRDPVALRATLAQDMLTSARFRLEPLGSRRPVDARSSHAITGRQSPGI